MQLLEGEHGVADEQHREDARAKVADEMARRGWNAADLARAAGVDAGTVGDFLNGSRWPQRSTQTKLDVALGWWPGSIGWYARGEVPPTSEGSETVGVGDDDGGVLLDLPAEALEGLGPVEREEVIAAAKLSALQTAREIRRRLGQ